MNRRDEKFQEKETEVDHDVMTYIKELWILKYGVYIYRILLDWTTLLQISIRMRYL